MLGFISTTRNLLAVTWESRDVPIRQSSSSTGLGWGSYLRGVIAGLVSVGVDVPPIEAVIGSNIPRGGGLLVSAALEVAAATMLEGITCHQLEPLEKCTSLSTCRA